MEWNDIARGDEKGSGMAMGEVEVQVAPLLLLFVRELLSFCIVKEVGSPRTVEKES